MDNTSFRLVLGSQSPRRQELMTWLDIPFSIVTSQAEEYSACEKPQDYCEDIARLKGQDVWRQVEKKIENPLVVSADTMVFLDDLKLGKPATAQEATRMLKLLSDRTHQVITSVYMKRRGGDQLFSVTSEVTFSPIDDVTLGLYLNCGESMDKAGAYGIQGKGLLFIRHLRGSYSNVVGFPLATFREELVAFIDAKDDDGWRSCFV